MKTIQEIGYATYSELKKFGIQYTRDLGINVWGFRAKEVTTIDGNVWEWIPEDEIFELKK